MTQAKTAFGTLFQAGGKTSPPTYQPLAECFNVKAPGIQALYADATNHQSPGGFEEFIPTGRFKAKGDPQISVNFLSEATQATILAALASQELDYYEIVFTNGKTCSFMAYVQDHEPAAASVSGTEKLSATVTFKITGPITWN